MTALLCALTLSLAQPAVPGQAEPPATLEAMNDARHAFEYGKYADAAQRLQALIEVGRFESPELRAEAYRLLGLSLFYLNRRLEADNAFREYLYLDPDAQLDPFYVPPAAVTEFERLKAELAPRLEPLRAQKHAEAEARKKALQEEAERRRRAQEEADRRRLAPVVERRVVQHEFWVTMMPFGLGQFQNGDRTLGLTLAVSEVLAGATSGGSALLIEELRDSTTGKFSNQGPYVLATRLNTVKWISAGLFYALWAAGAVHAAVHYQPEQVLPDRLVESPPEGIR